VIKENHQQELSYWLEEVKVRWEKAGRFSIPSSCQHIAIICDGNRRAARERDLPPYFGHRAGIEVIRGISRTMRRWGLKTLTFWVWSTENWRRKKEQISYIMNLAAQYLNGRQFEKELIENKVRFIHLGRKDRLPAVILSALKRLEEKTRRFSSFYLNLAMDYGGEDEIARAMVKIIKASQEREISLSAIGNHPELVLNYLDTAGQPKPDLVIRTGMKKGELPHTSGFMPLQTAYSCWSFISDYFPDLTPKVLKREIEKFSRYRRRLGA